MSLLEFLQLVWNFILQDLVVTACRSFVARRTCHGCLVGTARRPRGSRETKTLFSEEVFSVILQRSDEWLLWCLEIHFYLIILCSLTTPASVYALYISADVRMWYVFMQFQVTPVFTHATPWPPFPVLPLSATASSRLTSKPPWHYLSNFISFRPSLPLSSFRSSSSS